MPRRTSPVPWETYVRDVGQELHRRRVEAGLSQEDLAYRAGITRSHYQQMEKGESRTGRAANPSLKTLVGLAQVLGVEISDLVASVAAVNVGA